MILPIGANIEFVKLKSNPIFVSIMEAEKIAPVEMIEAVNRVMNDRLGSKAIIEYISKGIGINKMNNTAKNTPIADDEL